MQDEIKLTPEEKAYYEAINAQIDFEIELIRKDNEQKDRLPSTSD